MNIRILLIAGLVGLSIPAWAIGPNARLSSFLSLPATDLNTVTVKVTWITDQSESIPTIAFSVATVPDQATVDLFIPFRSPGVHYNNDDSNSDYRFSVSSLEMAGIIKNLSGIPAVANGLRNGTFISLALLRKDSNGNGLLVFEALLEAGDGKATLDAIIAGLISGNQGKVFLNNMIGFLKGS